jgi:DNA-directed RNA polymerase specialized sigma24 family protein
VGYQLLETDNSMTEILKKYADTVFRLCLIYMRNKADAEDAFQNVFLKLCKILYLHLTMRNISRPCL